jgi:hypothetical protein
MGGCGRGKGLEGCRKVAEDENLGVDMSCGVLKITCVSETDEKSIRIVNSPATIVNNTSTSSYSLHSMQHSTHRLPVGQPATDSVAQPAVRFCRLLVVQSHSLVPRPTLLSLVHFVGAHAAASGSSLVRLGLMSLMLVWAWGWRNVSRAVEVEAGRRDCWL